MNCDNINTWESLRTADEIASALLKNSLDSDECSAFKAIIIDEAIEASQFPLFKEEELCTALKISKLGHQKLFKSIYSSITKVLLKINFLLCVFHLLKSINGQLNMRKYNFSDQDAQCIRGIVYNMIMCETEEEYLRLYEELSTKHPMFMPYFNKEWHIPQNHDEVNFYFRWTSINRRTRYGMLQCSTIYSFSVGLYWTNNFVEASP